MINRKICLLGAFSVGKTSLVRRFVHNAFDERYITTLGLKIDTKLVEVNGDSVKMVMWDMEGEEPAGKGSELLTSQKKAYLHGVNGLLIVADGTRSITVDIGVQLLEWCEKEYPGVPAVMLINKSDLVDQWQLSGQKLEELSNSSHCFTTSSLSGENVESTFTYLAQTLVERHES